MDRRNFIYLSGTALSTLMFTDVLAGQQNQLVITPSKVFVKLDDGEHEMVPQQAGMWTYKNTWVKLSTNRGAWKIETGSPGASLHHIRLEWKYQSPKDALILGDHWERGYGDLQFKPADARRKMPWYFVQHNQKDTLCFGVKTGCRTICYWQVGGGLMQLTLDTRNGGKGVNLGQRTLEAAEIIATRSKGSENTFATATRFCKMMCDKPLLPKQPVYGINDWYVTYGANSAQIIYDHTARMAELATDTGNRPFSVIDSGWAAYSPYFPNDCCWQDDYSRANEHFKDMAVVADKVKQLGMRAGLWTRPLCAKHNDPKNLLAPKIKGRESDKKQVLDPSIAENLERIGSNISLYRQWGYELVKHDFTTYDMFGKWGFNMFDDLTMPGWNFADDTKTNAELILQLYSTIRKAAKDVYLLGCNTMSHLSAGLFEINRIGDDTSGKEWERTKKMGVNTLGFRLTQHKTFYAADGDCVGLTNAVPWDKNKQWLELLAKSGSPLFISAQESATGAERKAAIKQAFTIAAKPLPTAEPLDWLAGLQPAKWKLNGSIQTFNWD